MTDNTEKIKVINFLINKFAERKTSFENDYLYNVLKDIRKDYQEPVSEELEKEVDEYILDNFDDAEGRVYVLQCARHFAGWQKQQMMKDSIKGVVQNDLQVKLDNGSFVDLDPSMQLNPAFNVKAGDKVRLLLFYE